MPVKEAVLCREALDLFLDPRLQGVWIALDFPIDLLRDRVPLAGKAGKGSRSISVVLSPDKGSAMRPQAGVSFHTRNLGWPRRTAPRAAAPLRDHLQILR